MFQDIKNRKKPFVFLQIILVVCGLFLGGMGAYQDKPVLLGWMFWLFSAAFLLRGLEGYLSERKRYWGHVLMGVLYLACSLFIYPIW